MQAINKRKRVRFAPALIVAVFTAACADDVNAPGADAGIDASTSPSTAQPDATTATSDARVRFPAVDATAEDSATGATPDSAVGASSDASSDASTDASSAVTGDAGRCSMDLSNIGTGDFQISFTLTTTMVGHAALLNQRAICDYSTFWDIHAWFPGVAGADAGTRSMASLIVETDDATFAVNYTATTTPVVLNDGHAHTISVSRAAGRLTVAVDGNSTFADSKAAFGVLAPLSQGTDVCSAVDHRVPFVGTLGNVCISH